MHENKIRLIDEAISSEPIKNTFRLGWEFITLNKPFTLTVVGVMIFLTLLGVVPLIGFIFSLFSSVFALAVQIYVGRLVYETDNIETFVSTIRDAKGEDVIQHYFSVAMGVYMGWMVIGIGLIALITLLLGDMEISKYALNNNVVLLSLLSMVGLPALVIALLISYVQPLVQANIIMSDTFREGFFAVMSLFWVDTWRRAFQGVYFNYVARLGLLVLGVSFLFLFIFSIFAVIPIVNMVILLLFVYLLMIIMSVAAVMAKRLVE